MKNALIALLFVLIFALAFQIANLQAQVNAIETRLFGIYAVVDCMIEDVEDAVACANEILGE